MPVSAISSVRRKLRAIVYIRVSQEREEGYSPEQQLYACEQFAKALGITIVDVVYDLDLSGRGFAKRKIMDIIGRVDSGEATCVLVWKWSRFGRNIELAKQHIRLLEEAGGELLAATENFDTKTTTGRFGRDQMLLIAELQSGLIGDSWKETHERRFNDGRPHTGQSRFGYMRCPDCRRSEDNKRAYARCDTCKGVLQPDPNISGAYAEAYYRYLGLKDEATGVEYAEEAAASIAKDLTARGIRSVNGKYLTATTLLQILDTGFAAGLLRSRSAEMRATKPSSNKPETFDRWKKGLHKAIIPTWVWEKYKKKRLKCKGGHDRSPRYSVSGLLRCQETRIDGHKCNAKLYAASLMRTKGGYRKVMRCPGVENRSCPGATISLDKAERLTFEWVQKMAKESAMGEVAMERAAAAESSEARLALKELELKKVKTKLSKLLDGYLADLIEADEYSDKKDELEAQKEVLGSQIDLLQESIASNRVPHRKALLELSTLWPKLTDGEKRMALKRVLDRIEVHKAQGKGGRARTVFISKWDARRQAESLDLAA